MRYTKQSQQQSSLSFPLFNFNFSVFVLFNKFKFPYLKLFQNIIFWGKFAMCALGKIIIMSNVTGWAEQGDMTIINSSPNSWLMNKCPCQQLNLNLSHNLANSRHLLLVLFWLPPLVDMFVLTNANLKQWKYKNKNKINPNSQGHKIILG